MHEEEWRRQLGYLLASVVAGLPSGSRAATLAEVRARRLEADDFDEAEDDDGA